MLSTDVHGQRSTRTVRKVPVLAPAQLANLPAGRVVAFRRGMPPVIGRAEQAHRRRDVRTAILDSPVAAYVAGIGVGLAAGAVALALAVAVL